MKKKKTSVQPARKKAGTAARPKPAKYCDVYDPSPPHSDGGHPNILESSGTPAKKRTKRAKPTKYYDWADDIQVKK